MEAQEESLLQIANALPQQFDFYHLGEVILHSLSENHLKESSHKKSLLDDTWAIAFHLSGDLKGLMVVLFEKGLDTSLYAEIGNILASKLVNHLSMRDGIDVMISPPQNLSEPQMEQFLGSPLAKVKRNYKHLYQDQVVPFETIIIAPSSEEPGHA